MCTNGFVFVFSANSITIWHKYLSLRKQRLCSAAQIPPHRGGAGEAGGCPSPADDARASLPLHRFPRCASVLFWGEGPLWVLGALLGSGAPSRSLSFFFQSSFSLGQGRILGTSYGNRRKSGFHLTPRAAPSCVTLAGVKRRGEANGDSCGDYSMRPLCAQHGQHLLGHGLHCRR